MLVLKSALTTAGVIYIAGAFITWNESWVTAIPSFDMFERSALFGVFVWIFLSLFGQLKFKSFFKGVFK